MFESQNQSMQQNMPKQSIKLNQPKPPIQQKPPNQLKNNNGNIVNAINQGIGKVENGNGQNNANLNKYPKDLDDYIKKAKQISHPIIGSKLLGKEENLKIYKYEQPKKKAGKIVSLIFVGETGCGKSTLINGLLNYFLGILKTYDFRYKIVVGENEADQTKSQTQEISTYLVSSPLYPGITFQFIDTPGFADTDNQTTGDKRKDDLIFTKFVNFFKKKFFDEKELLNAACFIIKASANRFNLYQKEILSEVTRLFASDIKDNFLIMFTFSDTCKPKAVQFLTEVDAFKERSEKEKNESNKEKKKKLKWYWCVTTNKYFEDLSDAYESYKMAYDENIKELILFVNKVISLEALDAALTKKNLELNEELKETKKIIKNEILINLLKKYNALNDNQKELKKAIDELDNKQKELDKIQDSLNENNGKISELNGEIDQNKKDINNLQNKINEYNSSEKKLKDELTAITSELNVLDTNKKKTIQEKNELENNKNKIEIELNKLQDIIAKNKEENKIGNIEELQKQLNEKKNNLYIIKNDIEKYNKEKENLDQKLKKYNDQKALLDSQVTAIKNKKKEIENDKLEKQNKQKNLEETLNTYNTNNNINLLENLIKKLEESKLETKTIEEKYWEQELKKSKSKYLYCKSCQRNCHPECDCNWVIFWKDKHSWWCHKINKEGKCKACECNYEKHLRDFFKYESKEKTQKKTIGLSESEIREINNKIDLLKKQISQIKELQNVKNTINNQIGEISNYNSNINSKESDLKQVNDNIVEIEDYKNDINVKESSKKIIEEEVTKISNSIDYINVKSNYEQTNDDLTKKSSTIIEIGNQITNKTNEKKNKENQIQIINSNKDVNNRDLGKKQLLNQQKENEINLLKNEIELKTTEKNSLLNKIRDVYKKNKNSLERKNNDLNNEKEIIEKNCIYQLLRIQIIIDEIAKIQINKKNIISIDDEINNIISSNDKFIQQKELITKSIINGFKKAQQEMKINESKILVEYGIDKENLLSSSKK